jgi:hypothetical protein
MSVSSTQVWHSLSPHQQAQVNQALIALCYQIAAEVAQTARNASGSQEDGDEQG